MDGTSVAESAQRARTLAPSFGTIVVVGGGCYGSYYVRQLARASAAGAMRWERVAVVDHNVDCAVAADLRANGWPDPGSRAPEVVVADWNTFFSSYLDDASEARAATARDGIVPSPLMPHLLFEWLLRRARLRWPDRDVATRALPRNPDIPWQRADATRTTHWVSFAEWICPVNCIEPRLCPETRDVRTWSMPPAMEAYAASLRQAGDVIAGPVALHCTHRAFGVGMIDTRDVLAGDDLVAAAGTGGTTSVLIGTVSHCHGAWDILAVGPPP